LKRIGISSGGLVDSCRINPAESGDSIGDYDALYAVYEDKF
jgi:hypothetical protein